MTDRMPDRTMEPPSVVVAGHICLDLIPQLAADGRRRGLRPGALGLIGPLTMAVGGCVGNTGIALHRLGLRPTLVARVGDDRLGGVLTDLVHDAIPGGSVRLIAIPGGTTSYSLIFNQAGRDRSIQHFAGVNDTFVADDVPPGLLDSARLLHVGYPPLMAAIVADDGRELERLLSRARSRGAITSLDMASANLDPDEGSVSWRALLAAVLPAVDLFLPSLGEAGHLLGRHIRREPDGAPKLRAVARLGDEMIALGVAVAGVKLGQHGLYVRTSSTARLAAAHLPAPEVWADRQLYSTVFEAQVVGTAGAGDTTIAGFLFGMLAGMTPEAAVTAACAIGSASTEAVDGTSSVPGWPAVEQRLRRGWRRRAASPGPGWTPAREVGLWLGPDDAVDPRRAEA